MNNWKTESYLALIVSTIVLVSINKSGKLPTELSSVEQIDCFNKTKFYYKMDGFSISQDSIDDLPNEHDGSLLKFNHDKPVTFNQSKGQLLPVCFQFIKNFRTLKVELKKIKKKWIFRNLRQAWYGSTSARKQTSPQLDYDDNGWQLLAWDKGWKNFLRTLFCVKK